jgi:hypothetical protein
MVCTIGEDGGKYRSDADYETRVEVIAEMERHKEDPRMQTDKEKVDNEKEKEKAKRDNERAQIYYGAARLAAQQQGGAGGGRGEAGAERSMPAKLDRPPMEHGAPEGEWVNFLEEWARYKRSSQLKTEQEAIDQLWGCLSVSLKSLAQSDKLEDKDTEVALLAGLKKHAVRSTIL